MERHAANTLNERFAVLSEPPTSAVLSIDDDVIRPCLALDAAFAKWTRNPDRQVGFDARSHVVVRDGGGGDARWRYAYLSTTEKANAYSLTLTRCSFLHRDYLRQYAREMPAAIRETVARHFNCEDIAMSLWISAQTGHRPPLLADLWAVKSQIKMYVPTRISGGRDHKGARDGCVDDFADLLGAKGRLVPAELQHADLFDYGAPADDWNVPPPDRAASSSSSSTALQRSLATVERWKRIEDDRERQRVLLRELGDLRTEAARDIYEQGLLEKTQPWRDRFHPHHHQQHGGGEHGKEAEG